MDNKVLEKRKAMAEMLFQAIEANPGKWQKGWVSLSNVPQNGKTGRNYNGSNALFLYVLAEVNGYKDPRWVTFNQAKELDASIKSGEKSAPVFFWSTYDKKTKKEFDPKTVIDMTPEDRRKYMDENLRPVLKMYYVFNAEQCTNFPARENKGPTMTPEELAKQNELIEGIIRNSEAPISYGGNEAYYRPSTDTIQLPKIEDFKTKNSYYATALHEISHSTGHPSRLNRDLKGGFGSASYAVEELRAELASVFMQTEMGINLGDAELDHHAAYLKGWLAECKKDPDIFFKAASDAGKIVDYINNHYAATKKQGVAGKVYSSEEFVNSFANTNVNE